VVAWGLVMLVCASGLLNPCGRDQGQNDAHQPGGNEAPGKHRLASPVSYDLLTLEHPGQPDSREYHA